MTAVNKIESSLSEFFRRPRLPSGAKDFVSVLWPWGTLAFALVRLFNAWELWDLTQAVTRMQGYNVYYAANPYSLSSVEKIFLYIGIGLLALQAVVLLMAFSELRKRTAYGWKLSFIGGLLTVLYAAVALFIRDQGASVCVSNLIISVVGFYLLFQVQSRFRTPRKRTQRTKIN